MFSNVYQYAKTHGLSDEEVFELKSNFGDKVYLYAKSFRQSAANYQINICSNDCIAILNDKIKLRIISYLDKRSLPSSWVANAPTVESIRNGSVDGVLLSASVIVLDRNNKFLMIERDNEAPVEPNKWQFPSGRCECINALVTAQEEVDEEVGVIDTDSDSLIATSHFIKKHIPEYWHAQILIDNCLASDYKAIPFYDKTFNTIEQFFVARLPKGEASYQVSDNEFNRQVKFLSESEILSGNYSLVSILEDKKQELMSYSRFTDTDNAIMNF